MSKDDLIFSTPFRYSLDVPDQIFNVCEDFHGKVHQTNDFDRNVYGKNYYMIFKYPHEAPYTSVFSLQNRDLTTLTIR